ncbi:hypothetical protein JXA47_05295 [Candidatus Sumerlaeota bacterium]|nr:hypothetical protein [Candidatus Sumerlaeota bacterium]
MATVLGIAALLFVAWIQLRGGRTVDQPLVALLPADTPLAVQIHRLSDLLEAYDASPLAALIANDIEIGALLLSQDEFREWRDARAEAELETHLDLGRDFLIDWMGREVTLAFIPAAGEERLGLVVITQADLGFKERLAELVAQLYPGARLQTTDHRGTSITTYISGAPRDSLSFCRFGETVALSLRTDSTAYLRAIIDAVRAETPPEQPVFPPPTVPGLHAWVSGERFPAFLRGLGSDMVTAWLASPEGQESMARLAIFEEGRLTYALDDPRVMRLRLSAREGELPASPEVTDWHALTRRETLAAIHFEEPVRWWDDLGHLLFDLSPDVDEDWSEERRIRHLAKREWRVRLGHWLRDEVLPVLDGPATLTVDRIVPRLGLPGVQGALIWECSDPDALREALLPLMSLETTLLLGIDREFIPDWLTRRWTPREVGGVTLHTWQTALGQLGWAVTDDGLLVTLDDFGDPLTRQLLAGWPSRLDEHGAHRALVSLWGEAPRVGEIYLHALPLTQLTPMLLLSGDAWGESGQRNLNRIRMANHLFAEYPAIGLAMQQTGRELSLTLAIASSDEVNH